MSSIDRRDVSAKVRHAVKPLSVAGYEDAILAFRHFDTNRNGRIDLDELGRLMTSVHRRWNDSKTCELMVALDLDKGGDIDIQEFLNFVFPRKTGMGGTQAGLSDYDMVMEQFMMHDMNRNGTLDKREFHHLMGTLRNGYWSWEDTNAVFDSIDRNASDTIEVGELVAWILGVQKPNITQRHRAGIPTASKGRKVKVIVEMVTNERGQRQADFLQDRWSQMFKGAVAVKKVVDPNSEGHQSLVKKVSIVGSDVVFWERSSMMAYRDDPFLNDATRRQFVEELEQSFLPQMIETVGH